VTFDRGEQVTTVLWTTGRKPARVPVRVIAAEALLVDEEGRLRKVKPVSGVYWIDLPGATCSQPSCSIGGAPRLLVEAGRANGRPALGASATPMSTPTPGARSKGRPSATPKVRG
jgi:hypothetical protein